MGDERIQPKETILLNHQQGQRPVGKAKGTAQGTAHRPESYLQRNICTGVEKN